MGGSAKNHHHLSVVFQSPTKDTKGVEKCSRNAALRNQQGNVYHIWPPGLKLEAQKANMSKHIECCMMLNYTTSWISRNAWHNSKRCGCLNFVWTLCAGIYQPTFLPEAPLWTSTMYVWMHLSTCEWRWVSQHLIFYPNLLCTPNKYNTLYLWIYNNLKIYTNNPIYGCQPKNMGKPPNHPFVHRVFHYFYHPFWGVSPYFWVDIHIF